MPYSTLHQSVSNAFGISNTEEEENNNELNKNVTNTANKFFNNNLKYGKPTIFNKINPFLKYDGSVVNPNMDYEKLLNNNKINDMTKTFIENATGLKREQSTDTELQSESKVGDVSNALSSVNPEALVKMDVTQMPKLNTNQIETIIRNHFSKSAIISPSDAQGFYDAQNNTGMSALAMLV